MPLSLKTMEVQFKEDLWNKRLRTLQVYWLEEPELKLSNYYCYITVFSLSGGNR